MKDIIMSTAITETLDASYIIVGQATHATPACNGVLCCECPVTQAAGMRCDDRLELAQKFIIKHTDTVAFPGDLVWVRDHDDELWLEREFIHKHGDVYFCLYPGSSTPVPWLQMRATAPIREPLYTRGEAITMMMEGKTMAPRGISCQGCRYDPMRVSYPFYAVLTGDRMDGYWEYTTWVEVTDD